MPDEFGRNGFRAPQLQRAVVSVDVSQERVLWIDAESECKCRQIVRGDFPRAILNSRAVTTESAAYIRAELNSANSIPGLHRRQVAGRCCTDGEGDETQPGCWRRIGHARPSKTGPEGASAAPLPGPEPARFIKGGGAEPLRDRPRNYNRAASWTNTSEGKGESRPDQSRGCWPSRQHWTLDGNFFPWQGAGQNLS